jgi:DNA-binding LacI/PurR family transcriptional regulator
LALAGIDNIEISSFSKLSLTSIRQPYELIAQKAVSHLLEGISDPESSVKVKLKPELVVRQTTSTFSFKR